MNHLPQTRARRRGFTLVETSAAICVTTIAVCGLIAAVVSTAALRRVRAETTRAQRAAEQMVETLAAAPFEQVFAAFNGRPEDDGGLTIPPQPAGFAVSGLSPCPGDPDGFCGEIEFPALDSGGALELREDITDTALGMPRDLDRSGTIDAADHAGDYVVLPVRVRVRWRGVSGERQLDLETVLWRR